MCKYSNLRAFLLFVLMINLSHAISHLSHAISHAISHLSHAISYLSQTLKNLKRYDCLKV
jgi:hypothetical protein